MSIEKLKAMAYDLITQLEQTKQNLQVVNQKIRNYKPPIMKENKKK